MRSIKTLNAPDTVESITARIRRNEENIDQLREVIAADKALLVPMVAEWKVGDILAEKPTRRKQRLRKARVIHIWVDDGWREEWEPNYRVVILKKDGSDSAIFPRYVFNKDWEKET